MSAARAGLTADQALTALRVHGLAYAPDTRQPDGLWEARCPLCALYSDGRPLTIRENGRGKPARLECRNGCDAGEVVRYLATPPTAVEPPNGRAIVAESFATIRAERTRWLWQGRIPLRAPTLLVGQRKTRQVHLDRRARRWRLPRKLAGDLVGEPADALVLCYEDNAGPRSSLGCWRRVRTRRASGPRRSAEARPIL